MSKKLPETDMKKVLITASGYSHIRNFHLPYLREFQRLGWETHVACAGIPEDAPYVDRAVDLPFEKKLTAVANLRALRLLRRDVERERYDLIITHTSLAAFVTRMAVKGLRNRPKLITVMHGYLFDDETPLPKRLFLLNAERAAAPETDLLLVMNEWDYQTAKKYHLGKRIEKIHGTGVNFEKLDAFSAEDGRRLRERLGIPEDAFVLVNAGEFSSRKSQRVLIEAMQYLPDKVWLVLCGDGALRASCMAQAAKLPSPERVLFPGYVEDVGVWYRMADACVASSRSEGLPHNIVEAMHTGLPVVASAVKGHVDLIADGVSGLLYPYGDAKKCAECVRSIAGGTSLCDAMGRNAVLQTERYPLRALMSQIMSLYCGENEHV